MLDVSQSSVYAASVAFAVDFLNCLAEYDIERAESLVDVNDSEMPFAQSFPQPEGFAYCSPEKFENWSVHFVAITGEGLSIDFEMPFTDSEFRPMMARFRMQRIDDSLEVHFEAVVPS